MSWSRPGLRALVAALLVAACSDREPTRPSISAARGGESSDPTVTSADPNNAPQDTTLDVRVFGTNFDRGSKAEWALDGIVSAQVKTNSTRFVSSTQLIANITIAVDAVTGLYDVIVTTSKGKKGIGTELFEVKVKETVGSATVDDDPMYAVRSDGIGTIAPNLYVADQQCAGVQTFAGGLAQLRTIRNLANCQALTRGQWRYLTFVLPVALDLDQDGMATHLERAPARLQAGAYKHGATTTGVLIYILGVNADGTTTADTEWAIFYQTEAPIIVGSGLVRVISLPPGGALSDICATEVRRSGSIVCTSTIYRNVDLPFRITFGPAP